MVPVTGPATALTTAVLIETRAYRTLDKNAVYSTLDRNAWVRWWVG